MSSAATWFRALPGRYGKRTLFTLGAIALVGLLARAYVVVEPVENPADDSRAYFALSKSLYEGSGYGGLVEDASDWSPGAPLLYAAAFVLTGGAREGTARIVEALMGVAGILVVFALAHRLALGTGLRGGRAVAGIDPPAIAGLLAALGVAIYPPFIHSTGELMSEPPALLTLPAAVLAFLWAAGLGGAPARRSCRGKGGAAGQAVLDPPPPRYPRVRWLLPGLLFGATAMFRPEYLLVGAAFVVLAGLRELQQSGWRPGLAVAALMLAGLLIPILPWTVRNAVVLDKLVPISTGGGKALYTGTFLPADGEYQRVKAILYERRTGISLDPHSRALDEVEPTPLFDEVAETRYPDLPRDEALGRVGRENFEKFFDEDPVGYLGMTGRKVGRMWSSGVGEAMSGTPGRAIQIALVGLGLAGLALLGARRRWWELAALAAPIALVTLVGAATLAAPRRNEVLMTLVIPLAALALCQLAAAISSRRKWSRVQASSPPS